MQRHYIVFTAIALLMLLVDQVTKYFAVKYLLAKGSVEVIGGFFNLSLVYNYGAAFGIFNDQSSSWQTCFFAIITILSIFVIIYLLRTLPKSAVSTIALALIMSGAIGNLIDRLKNRAVVDFLDFYHGSWHWPAFNVADICICLGSALIFVVIWKNPAKKKA